MRRRRLQENSFENTDPVVKKEYYKNLQEALQHVQTIKSSIEGLNSLITRQLYSIDINKYPALADWMPEKIQYEAPFVELEADLLAALDELGPLMMMGKAPTIESLGWKKLGNKTLPKDAKLGERNGVEVFEHPTFGDESPFIVKMNGEVYLTNIWEDIEEVYKALEGLDKSVTRESKNSRGKLLRMIREEVANAIAGAKKDREEADPDSHDNHKEGTPHGTHGKDRPHK